MRTIFLKPLNGIKIPASLGLRMIFISKFKCKVCFEQYFENDSLYQPKEDAVKEKFYLFRRMVKNANRIYPLFLTAICYPFLKDLKKGCLNRSQNRSDVTKHISYTGLWRHFQN